MNPRSRQALLWTAIIVVCGLVIRRAPLHLPVVVTKYGGSMLWAAMVYAIFVVLLPKRRSLEIGIAASLFAIATLSVLANRKLTPEVPTAERLRR